VRSPDRTRAPARRGTKLAAIGSASAPTFPKAEIRIEFSRAGAFIFHATNLRPQHLVNRSAVVDAYKHGQWRRSWLLVDALHIAERATIVVSEDSSAEIVLVSEESGILPGISLADPRISLTVSSTHGSIVHVVGGRLPPLRAHCVQCRSGHTRR
jgi:hypothetical protein